MYEEIRAELKPLSERVDALRGHLDIEGRLSRIAAFDDQALQPGFWEDNETARRLLKEKGHIERTVRDWKSLATIRDDAETLLELAEEAEDEDTAREAEVQVRRLEKLLHALETHRLMPEEADANDAILEINPGAGGTDAMDWAEMLLRMYTRWAENEGFQAELLDRQYAEEAGIKSAALAIRGPYAYGYLQAETGVHRLVRMSPFDQARRRHTAFAAVAAYPDVDDDIEIDLNPADIEMQTMRASGAGGQHVNTTDSAVRLIHHPTGLKMLRAKLYQQELQKRIDAQAEANAKKKKIDFGSQIRSYVLQPYQQVKDLRTGHTAGDVTRVLDGDLTPFMESWLVGRADGTLEEKQA
ncbi:MAG: peptide chain release factor 2 [Deltaproteobacteria bacterium]|nr:peptide chain release factor 2 [Deltaproteobacteria bacterium]